MTVCTISSSGKITRIHKFRSVADRVILPRSGFAPVLSCRSNVPVKPRSIGYRLVLWLLAR